MHTFSFRDFTINFNEEYVDQEEEEGLAHKFTTIKALFRHADIFYLVEIGAIYLPIIIKNPFHYGL